jgi:hypothetical protein
MSYSRKLLLFTAFLLFVLAFNACKKDSTSTETSTTTQQTWASDEALAQKTFDDIQGIVDEGSSRTLKSLSNDTVFLGSCATVTLDLSVMPYKLTIDFGTTNCLCPDGKYRRGKIISTFNGAYSDSGTVIRDSLDNYYVDEYKVQGVRVVINEGHNNAGHPHFSVTTNGSIIKPNNGGTITWNSADEREWIAGYNTFTWLDDEYLITGTTNGTAANGQSYTVTINTALDVKLNCHYITAGTLTLKPEGVPDITMDFGDGTCDNVATAKILGITVTILM